LWFDDYPKSQYLFEGAEQKVYLWIEEKSVIKTNTEIFYAFWSDYFDSLLLHNLFFYATKYDFMGFTMYEDDLCAVVKQPFIESNEDTDLDNVRAFLLANGFQHYRNNDYYHPELRII